MNINPRNDPGFQKALREIMKGVVPFTSVVTEAPQAPRTSSLWTSEEDFTDLRIEFEWAHCSPDKYPESDKDFAFQAYRAVRDTPEAQGFVAKNPLYFSKIHDALCSTAISIREVRRKKQEQRIDLVL